MLSTKKPFSIVKIRAISALRSVFTGRQKLSIVKLSTTLRIVLLASLCIPSIQGTSLHASETALTHYDAELARVDQHLQATISIAAQRPESWLHLESVANAHLERARLTGEFNDYQSALNVMSQVSAISGEQGGPALSRATLHFAVHRLPEIEADLLKAETALLVDTPTKLTIQGLRADVLLYRGQYEKAKFAYDQLEAISPSVSSATRLANYHSQLGQYIEAEAWYQHAEQRVNWKSAHLRSWLKLQLGILDLQRGRLDNAHAHYNEGLNIFPGYWLLEEHVAEIDALQGRDDLAEEKYRDLIKRTDSPVFMSALADILSLRKNKGNQSESVRLRESAKQWYETRINKIPELMSGHALGYLLQHGDRQRTLQLAQDNYNLRPGGEAALQLAQAHVRIGQIPKAVKLIETILSSPYRSAELHATADIVFRANGNRQRADEHKALAHAINQILAVDDMSWLLEGVASGGTL